ncbi:MAG: signal recognition particle-docking protein FtsY [Deltaproteobacteria bacterium]|nr:signal recognition particle-docking protein FtsY [Deltaproteobacteria bacterium]
MNTQIVFTADAGAIVAILILFAFGALIVAAAWKFITKKKAGLKYEREEVRPAEEEKAKEPEEAPAEAGKVEEEEYGEGLYGDRLEDETPPEPAKPVPPEALKPVEPPKPPPKAVEPKPEAAPPAPRPKEKPKPKTLKEGLGKTREGFIARLNRVLFGGKKSVEQVLEEVEEVLFTADIGVKTSQRLLEFVRKELSGKDLQDPAKVRDALKAEIARIVDLNPPPFAYDSSKPFVMMMVGVNGVGKTTTIGKIGRRLNEKGMSVIMAAGDTFRAAAAEQLEIWGDRAGVQVIRGQDGGDPAAVIYDAVSAAKSKGADVVIADTAGRLHTKVPLMEELKKVKRVMAKAHETAPNEVMLVVDANNGQNAIAQAREFNEALGITGIILTKLDGTAKGGVIIGICDELKIPVRYIGIGETVEDLRPFDPKEFTEALFEE